MRSWEIVQWQDNIAEDSAKGTLNLNENLLNSVLELSFQLAMIREETFPDMAAGTVEMFKSAMSRAYPDYTIKVFGVPVFSMTTSVPRPLFWRIRSGYRGAVRWMKRITQEVDGA